jgi:protein-S-isoprenylcysteine O-methyltransferase Ste14
MAPLPYPNAGARIVFYALIAVFVLAEQRIRWRSWRNRQGSAADQGTFLVVVGAIAVGVVGAFLLAADVPSAAIPFARSFLFVLGLVMMCAGIALRQWAVALLGRFFTVDVRVHPDQVIVERGPYRWLRHPSYTGLILTLLGIGVALANWASLTLLAVVPTAGLVVRIRQEERALVAALGEPYRRFAAGRARLVPGIW